ncbi:MAG: MiaB/RimO family radical SAM methylthiotransferase, partial [Planctomycetes bacterium]|nr:MiaB/RimO family radical SAM methylthiotransferase [Planctomycetota bacterium]
VVGCSTAEEKERIARIPQVALAAGNREKSLVASFLRGDWRPGERPPPGARDLLDLGIARWSGRTRAVIKVQDGCRNFCSFCVIPRLRGLSRSRPAEAVVDEVRRLAGAGHREIVISGVQLQDYGLDLDPEAALPSLLERVASAGSAAGVRRIRLSSLGAPAFTAGLLDVLADPVFCRHWHVPIQAGDDEVLRRMRRGYTVAEYRRAIAALRERFEDPAITTDVIAGHPGETEERFERSLDLYRELGFARIHVFPFSAREGTLAARFPDRVAADEIRSRAARVGEAAVEMRRAYERRWIGRPLEILVEGAGRSRREGWLEGLTDRYVRVRCPLPRSLRVERLVGRLLRVRAAAQDGDGLVGEVLDPLPGAAPADAGPRAAVLEGEVEVPGAERVEAWRAI